MQSDLTAVLRVFELEDAVPAAARMLAEDEAFWATVREGLREIEELDAEIRNYPVKPQSGQWVWEEDAEKAMEYHQWITTGWPAETRGFRNPYAGLAFPN